ncbi:DUF2799 domain-containing protein, partial [Rhizobium rosettiformans]
SSALCLFPAISMSFLGSIAILQEGSLFRGQTRFAAHVKSCARINIVPDQSRWYQGYQVGVTRYCTPLNGLSRGEAGDRYHNVCPPELAGEFLRGYGIGQKAYTARSRVNSLRNQISTMQSSIDNLYNQMRASQDEQARRNMRDEIDRLDRDIRRARLDVSDAEFALHSVQREVDLFRQNPGQASLAQGY